MKRIANMKQNLQTTAIVILRDLILDVSCCAKVIVKNICSKCVK